MEPFTLKTKEYFSISQWENDFPDLIAGFTTKNGGFSKGDFTSLNFGFHVNDTAENVFHNKQKLANLIDFSVDKWVAAEQTHGIEIKKIAKIHSGMGSNSYDSSILNTDGFYTREKGILLTLCYADCVPLYFLDKKAKTIGVAHAGWKGTVDGIAKEMINRWIQEGVELTDISVVIGPSICEKCYIVDDYVINFVQKILVDVEKKPYNLVKEGQYSLNLKQLNKQIVMQAGITERNIFVSNLCSSCNQAEFYSHRRDNGITGRMMSFIGWKEDSVESL